MTKQYGFYFNSSVCIGCKTCQIACKDKHDLEVGMLWRRVYEVVGGDWVPNGKAWNTTVFAYNISMSCNHCANPACVEECPTEAISKRDDGIVILDVDKCEGYKRCITACPYDAPQYHFENEKSYKCHLCYDYIDQGKNPACVDACIMRALDFGELADLQAKYGTVNEVYPLPSASKTTPSYILTPHKDAVSIENEPTYMANDEEI